MKLKRRTCVALLFIYLLGSSVLTAQVDPIPVVCGSIVEGELRADGEIQYYSVPLEPGDEIIIETTHLTENAFVYVTVLDPVGQRLIRYGGDETSIQVGSRGLHTIEIQEGGSIGVYIMGIGCNLRDGTVVEPGDAPTAAPIGDNDSQPSQTAFSGYGFPGVNARDFTLGIEIPLARGQAMTAPVGGDLVTLYTYTAAAGETATLRLSRVSGEISAGVAVINKDTNAVIFLGGMPFSNNLSVELSFPADGTYAIGLFRLDTAERSGTSGAVQITLE